EVRDQADVPLPVVREVDVLLAAPARRIALRHVLAHDLDRSRAHEEQRTHVTDRGREDTARAVRPPAQRVRPPDRRGLLPPRTAQAADHLVLAIEIGEDLLDLTGEPEVVVDLVQLLAGQSGHDLVARRHPRLFGHWFVADPVEPSVPAAIRRHYGQPR